MKFIRKSYRVCDLTSEQWQQIREQGNLVVSDTDSLIANIKERNQIIIFWDRQGALVGLFTIDLYHQFFQGKEVVTIFTGNTWLQKNMRGNSILQAEMFRSTITCLRRWPKAKQYWFFGTNSYKSFLYLRRNLKVFWPRGENTPNWEREYIEHLSHKYYQCKIDPQRLVYEAENGRSLSKEETTIPKELEKDPDIQYFIAKNPRFRTGSKLMCLAPLSFSNMLSVLIKMARRAIKA